MTLTGTGYAKINLALHVRRRREDGYHELETLFAFARDGDGIEIDPEAALGLTIDGPFGVALAGEAGDDNLVMHAARALGRPAAIRLTKTLPIAAGIGGGSADAAAVLRLLGERRDAAELLAIAAGLGADVPACVASVTVRGDGRGYELRPIEAAGLSGMALLLVNPRVPLSTGPVFRAWDGKDRGALGEGDPMAVALAGRNDLEAPALGLCPVIGEVLALLRAQNGVTLARMSGSGATCFALFDSDAARDAANAAIGDVWPDWWRLATALR